MAPPRTHGHGTRACYRRGCRLPECVQANTDWLRDYNRRTKRRRPREEYEADRHIHPSLNCYKRHGCRCPGCRRWNAFDVRIRNERRAWDDAYAQPRAPEPKVERSMARQPGDMSPRPTHLELR